MTPAHTAGHRPTAEEEAETLEAQLNGRDEEDVYEDAERHLEYGYRSSPALNVFNQQTGSSDASFWSLCEDPTKALYAYEYQPDDWAVRVVSAREVGDTLHSELIERLYRDDDYGCGCDCDDDDDGCDCHGCGCGCGCADCASKREALVVKLDKALTRWWEGDPRKPILDAVPSECLDGSVGEDCIAIAEVLDLIASLRRGAEGVEA